MRITIDLSTLRQQNVRRMHAAFAAGQGCGTDEARQRGIAWTDFEDIAHHSGLATFEAATLGGVIDIASVYDRTLGTDALAAMVAALRAEVAKPGFEPPPSQPSCLRSGWLPGPEGLTP